MNEHVNTVQLHKLVDGLINGISLESFRRGLPPMVLAMCAIQAASVIIAWSFINQKKDWDEINDKIGDMSREAFHWGAGIP